jgi:hypothetical protein
LISPPSLTVSSFYFGKTDGADVFGDVESRSLAHVPQKVCRTNIYHPGLYHDFEVAFILYALLILEFRGGDTLKTTCDIRFPFSTP